MRSGVDKHSDLMPIKNWRRIGIPYRHDIGMILKRSRALNKGAMFSTGSGEQIVPEEAQHAETQRSSTSSFHWTQTAADSTQLFHLTEYGPRVPESSRGGGHRLANTCRVGRTAIATGAIRRSSSSDGRVAKEPAAGLRGDTTRVADASKSHPATDLGRAAGSSAGRLRLQPVLWTVL